MSRIGKALRVARRMAEGGDPSDRSEVPITGTSFGPGDEPMAPPEAGARATEQFAKDIGTGVAKQFTFPGQFRRAFEPQTPGMLSEEDLVRRQAAEQGAPDWSAGTALGMLGLGSAFPTKNALGVSGARPPVAAAETASPFYSAAEEAVNNTPMKSATSSQWLSTLRNATGVKPEELDWMGVPEFLQGRQGAIPKQDLLNHIANNKVNVQEVMKGQNLDVPKMDAIRRDNFWEIRNAEDGSFITNIVWPNASREEAIMEAANRWQQQDPTKMRTTQPKFGTGMGAPLPGGANYRELLLTLSRKQLSPEYLEQWARKFVEGTGDNWDALTPQQKDTWIKTAQEQGLMGKGPQDFTGSHWDEPNVLAHVRFDDRNIGGDKTLHMAEIQSDWHQRGRREGYAGEGKDPMPDLVARQQQIEREIEAQGHDATPAQQAAWMELTDQMNAFHDKERYGVPDAPFKTSWPELALKRMIRYAAEHGYDRISWDNGMTNAERYDLSKHVNDVQYEPATQRLRAYGKEGFSPVVDATVAPERLPDYIGKEAADKLLNKTPRAIPTDRGDVPMHVLSGLDLKVGGEGMKGFYDKMLPTIANKLGKKYGARVEQSQISGPKYGKTQQVPIEDTGQEQVAHTIHTMKITPELRKAALQQGFPLFARGGRVTKVDMEVAKRLADPRVKKALNVKPKINRDYDIPYVAGISNDMKTLYQDRRFVSDKNLDALLWLHECGEALFMKHFGDEYQTAHRLITEAEKKEVKRRGLDWKRYIEYFEGWSKRLEHEPVKRVPRDLFLKPYQDSGDRATLRRMRGHLQV